MLKAQAQEKSNPTSFKGSSVSSPSLFDQKIITSPSGFKAGKSYNSSRWKGSWNRGSQQAPYGRGQGVPKPSSGQGDHFTSFTGYQRYGSSWGNSSGGHARGSFRPYGRGKGKSMLPGFIVQTTNASSPQADCELPMVESTFYKPSFVLGARRGSSPLARRHCP